MEMFSKDTVYAAPAAVVAAADKILFIFALIYVCIYFFAY